MINKKLILSLVIISIFYNAFAQVNYVKGIIVKNNYDTVNGYINYVEWHKNPSSIKFKKELDGEPTEFHVSDLVYLDVIGMESYQRAVVVISMNKVEDGSGIYEQQPVTDTVLLKIIQKGSKVTLYSYQDKIKRRFYISEDKSDTPKELYYGSVLKDNRISYVRSYVNQLVDLARRKGVLTEGLKRRISGAGYFQSDVERIIAEINGDAGKVSANRRGRNKLGGYLVLGLGLERSALFYEGNTPLVTNKQYYNAPCFIVAYDLLVNPNIGRLMFRPELIATQANNKVTSIIPDATGRQEHIQEVSFTKVSLGVNVLYNVYQKSAFQFFVGTGFRDNLLFNTSNVHTTNFYTSNGTLYYVSKQTDNPEINKGFLCYFFKVGATFNKRIEGYINYMPRSRVTSYHSLGGFFQSLQFGVNYHFVKGLRDRVKN